MKKKIVALCLTTMLAFSLAACGGQSDDKKAESNVEQDERSEDKDENKEAKLENEESQPQNEESQPQNEESQPENEDATAEGEGTFVYDAPAEFVYNETDKMWYSADELANINYLINTNDGSFKLLTQEMMEAEVEAALTQAWGEQMDVEITDWEEIEIGGYAAIDYSMQYEYSGVTLVQRQVIVEATDNFHYVTMTSFGSEEYNAAFDAVVESMRFE